METRLSVIIDDFKKRLSNGEAFIDILENHYYMLSDDEMDFIFNLFFEKR